MFFSLSTILWVDVKERLWKKTQIENKNFSFQLGYFDVTNWYKLYFELISNRDHGQPLRLQ